jgi:uncharacterized protein with von Willebrand factor type A (vWA) domain
MCVSTTLFPAIAAAEQVQELELSVDLRSLDKLLDFLSCSFMGGTDVDRPLQLSLERLQKDEWQQVRRVGVWVLCRGSASMRTVWGERHLC